MPGAISLQHGASIMALCHPYRHCCHPPPHLAVATQQPTCTGANPVPSLTSVCPWNTAVSRGVSPVPSRLATSAPSCSSTSAAELAPCFAAMCSAVRPSSSARSPHTALSMCYALFLVKAQIGPNFGKYDPHLAYYDSTSGLHGGHILALTITGGATSAAGTRTQRNMSSTLATRCSKPPPLHGEPQHDAV
jgi:hypothetical protein